MKIILLLLFSYNLNATEINKDPLHAVLQKKLTSSNSHKTKQVKISPQTVEAIAKFKLSTQTFAQGDISQIKNWYSNLQAMQKVAFDSIVKENNLDNTTAKRVAASLVSNIVAGWITNASSLTMHEAAHGKAAQSVGASGVYYTNTLYNENDPEKLTIGELYLQLLTGQGTSGATTFYYLPSNYTAEDRLTIASAGLNAQSEFAEELVEENRERQRSHFLDALPYLLNKMATYNYFNWVSSDLPGNDLQNYIDGLIKAGYLEENKKQEALDKLQNLSLFSILLSGGTWQGILSEIAYIQDGSQTIPILGIKTTYGSITLPEFSTYLNNNNISIKGSIAFIPQNNKIKNISLSYEQTAIGQCREREVGISLTTALGNMESLTRVVIGNNDHFGVTERIRYPINQKTYIYGKAKYDTGTMEGRRKCYSINGDPCILSEVGVEYHFRLH